MIFVFHAKIELDRDPNRLSVPHLQLCRSSIQNLHHRGLSYKSKASWLLETDFQSHVFSIVYLFDRLYSALCHRLCQLSVSCFYTVDFSATVRFLESSPSRRFILHPLLATLLSLSLRAI